MAAKSDEYSQGVAGARPDRLPALVPLPIDAALPEIASALREAGALVLVAPPGSGKTTRLPPALLDSGLLGEGICLVVEPRRLAARAAAQRIAEERGWDLGGEVGYEVRFERRASPGTRLLFVTPGILTARLQDDPFLETASAVVLDEFHERSLETDLILALAREARSARPDLRIAVLSATIDPGPVAAYLGGVVREVPGRPYPVSVEYLGTHDPDRAFGIPKRVAAGVRRAWAELRRGGPAGGDVLAFLPGAAEIRKTAEELSSWAGEAGAAVLPLHGDLPLEAQAAVLRRPTGSSGRVILATNVAETSVTVEGVFAVVDSGFARVLRHESSAGLDRLELAPISRASADQRAGRAGRLGPGVAYRLWTAHDELSRPSETPPEVLRVDLSSAYLQVAAWGAAPETFPWFQAPSPEALRAARLLLEGLGAIDGSGRITPTGRKVRRLPVHPRVGRMLLDAAERGLLREGAALAALLSERDLLLSARAFPSGERRIETSSSDLLDRLDLLEEAGTARFDPGRLRRLEIDPGAARSVARARDQLVAILRSEAETKLRGGRCGRIESDLLRILLAGYPDRVARRRSPGSDRFLLAGGSGAVLSNRSSVRKAELVIAVRLERGRRGERSEDAIRWASRIEPEWLAEIAPLERRTEVSFDPVSERVVGVEREFYRDLVLRERNARPEPGAAAALLAIEAAKDPLRSLRPGREALGVIARCRFLARYMPELGVPTWDDGWAEVLEALCTGKSAFEELRRADLARALRSRLTRYQLEALSRHAPERLPVPSGNRHALEYPPEGPPVLAVKVQEVFGLAESPRVAAGRVAVVLHLLGPHGRPLQVTSDLASFWERTYPEIRKEMRGRYPRHFWPEDPRRAPPELLTRHRRGAR